MYCAWRIPAHLRCTQCSILLHLMDICFLSCICLWQISQIQTCLFKVVGPGLVLTSPAFVSSSASHPASPHGWHCPVNRAPIAGGRKIRPQFAQQLESACRVCRLEQVNWNQLILPGPSASRSRVFMESSQLYAATLTHHSTEPLTTRPDYDPLLLLLELAGDVHPNPGPPRYPCSVCFKSLTSQGTSYLCTRCSHWVHSRCSGLRNVVDYRKANVWICTACMTPPQPRTPLPPSSPAHTPTMSDKTFNIQQ